MPTGDIHLIPIKGDYEDKSRPCLVVLDIAGTKECIIVPAYTEGRPAVTEAVAALVKMGYHESQVVVRLDNALCCEFVKGYQANIALWKIGPRPMRLSRKDVNSGKRIGRMLPAGLIVIVDAILNLARQNPEVLSTSLVKKLRGMRRELEKTEDQR